MDLEEWLKGPIPGIPDLLQPIAHALLQVRKELDALMEGFPDELLWKRPGGVASAGFHLRHLTGVLDRLFTYAKGELLSQEQLWSLQGEGKPPEVPSAGVTVPPAGFHRPAGASEPSAGVAAELVASFNRQVDLALASLASTDPAILLEPRGVGRAQIPSTVLGLLVHSAEHTTRHFGQLLVTVRVLGQG
jgi:hypothetical protein